MPSFVLILRSQIQLATVCVSNILIFRVWVGIGIQDFKAMENRLAFIMSPRLGDSIIAMVVVYNLHLQGYQCVVYSKFLVMLKEWFPWCDIRPIPDAETAQREWPEFTMLLHTYPHDVLYDARLWHPQVKVLADNPLHNSRVINMVDTQLLMLREEFGIENPERSNGIQAPAGCSLRKNYFRVVLHPTAAMKVRYWLPNRYIVLANKLRKLGFHPVFITTESERAATAWIEKAGFERACFATMGQVAQFLYESGWFVGSDSGLGHLASCMGIPTVSLHQRAKVRKRWRPGFAPNEGLIACVNLIYKPWKERFWKYFITVGMVVRAFKSLVKRCHGVYPIHRK